MRLLNEELAPEFDVRYKHFLDHLDLKDYSDFTAKYMHVHRQLESLLREYNDKVSERITANSKNEFIEHNKQLNRERRLDLYALINEAWKYKITSEELFDIVNCK